MPSRKSIRKQNRKAYLDTLPTTTLAGLIERGAYPADYMFMSTQELSEWAMQEIKACRKVSNMYDYEVRED